MFHTPMRKSSQIDELANRIRNWEIDIGESFCDYFTNINAPSFMFWCLGRGYLTKEKFNMWEESFSTNKHGKADDFNCFLYNEHNDPDAQFAVVISEDWNEHSSFVAFRIFAEFCLGSTIYMKRLEDFFKGKGWSTEYVEEN
jgi:hypothetical protein